MGEDRKRYSKSDGKSRRSRSRFQESAENKNSEKNSRFSRNSGTQGPNVYVTSGTSTQSRSSTRRLKDSETSSSSSRRSAHGSQRSSGTYASKQTASRVSSRYEPTSGKTTVNLPSAPKTKTNTKKTYDIKPSNSLPLMAYTNFSKNKTMDDEIAEKQLASKRILAYNCLTQKLIHRCIDLQNKGQQQYRRSSDSILPPLTMELDPTNSYVAYISAHGVLYVSEHLSSLEPIGNLDVKGSSTLKFGAGHSKGLTWSRKYHGMFAVLGTEKPFNKEPRHFIKLFEKNRKVSLKLLHSLNFQEQLVDCKFSPDGDHLAILTKSNKLLFYSSDLETFQYTLDLEATSTCFNWHPSSQLLYVGTECGDVLLFKKDKESWTNVATLNVSQCSIVHINYDSRGHNIFFGSVDGIVAIYSIQSHDKIASFESEKGYALLSLDANMDGQIIFVSYIDEDTNDTYAAFYHWSTRSKLFEEENYSHVKSINYKTGFLFFDKHSLCASLIAANTH